MFLKSNLAYVGDLVRAGVDGVATARREQENSMFASPVPALACASTLIGAGIGVLTARVGMKQKSPRSLAIGGLIGSIAGLSAALAWASRDLAGPAAQKAAQFVGAARDAHWLENHPINYA